LRGPVVLNVQGKNGTRHRRGGKQTPGNPDLGHSERARRRNGGNKSDKGKVTNKRGGPQGEVRKEKKLILQTEYEFLPRTINEVAAVDLPAPYARVKVHGREIFAKGLIDTGNSCKYSLISEDFFNLCGGAFLHSQQVRLNTAAEGEGLPVLGQAIPFKIYLEGIKKPITIKPLVKPRNEFFAESTLRAGVLAHEDRIEVRRAVGPPSRLRGTCHAWLQSSQKFLPPGPNRLCTVRNINIVCTGQPAAQ